MRALGITLLLVAGCPAGSASNKPNEPARTCTKIGDSCLVSEGKIGTCVERVPPCAAPGADCFVCQSQH